MKKTFVAIAVSAGLFLAPVSAALANSVSAQSDDAIASAWVPATLAEQQAARGGESYSSLYPLFSALETVCYSFNFSFSFQVGSYSYSRYCGKGRD